MNYLKSLTLGIALSLLAGCATRPVPDGSQCNVGGTVSNGFSESTGEQSSPEFSSPAPRILVLSGGGKWGAFGAGYLNGWYAAADGLPEFDIVTGVSAGAILATAAFIGEPGALDIYRNISQDDIFSRKLLPFSLFSDGLASTARLRTVIEGMVGEQELLAVARRARQGAQLLVGAVNLDNGVFVELDLGEIAIAFADEHEASKRGALRRRYVDAIVASGTVPLAMEPVYIDCAMMVDGGVRHQLFLPESASMHTARKQESRGSGSNGASMDWAEAPMLFVIVNGQTRSNFVGYKEDRTAELTRPDLSDIAQRSIAAMLDSNLDSDIAQICDWDSDFRVSIISADQLSADDRQECVSKDDGGFFPQPFMSCLYDRGFQQGQIYKGSQSPHGKSCKSDQALR